MYNRYIPNQQGGYTRIPQQEPLPQEPPQRPPEQPSAAAAAPPPPPKPPAGGPRVTDSLTAILRHALDRLHLDHVDTGDLLLLGLLFLLFREDADEELLVALGLLLIL